MRISLITFHNALNYGAMLQAYATYAVLNKLGHYVEIIDYRIPDYAGIVTKLVCFVRRLYSNRFINKYYPCKSRHYRTLEELRENPPKSDCYIVGSDQVWNVDITKHTYLGFFLDFGSADTLRYAFSSSFGGESINLTKTQKIEIKRCLKRFNGIALREATGIKICQKEFDVEPNSEVVLDPTMLLEDEYNKMVGDVKEKKQILVYKLNFTSAFDRVAKHIAQSLNLKLAMVGRVLPQKGYKYIYPTDPINWLKDIKSSKLILTDSFHGVVFSILLNKRFVAFCGNPQRVDRLYNLLGLFGLEDRLCDNPENLDYALAIAQKDINYSCVDSTLKKLRQKSIDILKMFVAK